MTDEPPHDLYPQADVFVLPSEGESFGMVAAEAAAAGTPVIVTDRCGIAGFFEDGEALVVPYERAAIVEQCATSSPTRSSAPGSLAVAVAAARARPGTASRTCRRRSTASVASRTAATKLSTEDS